MPVVECVKAMYERGFAILFTSGREDKYRAPTVSFIEQWCKVKLCEGRPDEEYEKVIDYQLIMRPTGDQRKDCIVKRELFDANIRDKYNVVFALDDRNQVVDNWREMGIATFQVAPGAF
jgi:hypothetical protein